jgi:hypothetical protein
MIIIDKQTIRKTNLSLIVKQETWKDTADVFVKSRMIGVKCKRNNTIEERIKVIYPCTMYLEYMVGIVGSAKMRAS